MWRITVSPEVVRYEVGRISLPAVIALRSLSPLDRLQHTFQVVDNITWQRSNHCVRAGVEWEHSSVQSICEAACETVADFGRCRRNVLLRAFDLIRRQAAKNLVHRFNFRDAMAKHHYVISRLEAEANGVVQPITRQNRAHVEIVSHDQAFETKFVAQQFCHNSA